jgi:hypothetical protein
VKDNSIYIRAKNRKGAFTWCSVPHQIVNKDEISKLDKKMREKIVKIYKYTN